MQGWLVPKGPETARTYWLRRVAVLLLVAALIAVVGQLIKPDDRRSAQAGQSSPAASPNPATPSPTVDPSSATAPKTGVPQPELPPPACDPQALGLQIDGPSPVAVDAGSAEFVVRLQTDLAACDLNLADHPISLVITSGTDRIWASDDCTDWRPTGVLQLTQGAEQQVGFGWPVRRSSGCELVDAQLGAGTYVATAILGDQSARFVLQLQN